MKINYPIYVEDLAEFFHDQVWSLLIRRLFNAGDIIHSRDEKGTIIDLDLPSSVLTMLYRQMNTPFKELSEEEKESGRLEARKIRDHIRETLIKAQQQIEKMD